MRASASASTALAAPALAVLLGLGACATIPRLHAADDVHALLVAVRDGDRAAFDAHIDKGALKTQLKSRLIARAAAGGGDAAAVGVVLLGPLVDVGVEALVRPQVFRAQAIRLGYDPERPLPSTLAIASLVRPLGDGRACVSETRGGPCVLDFTDEDGTYRLSGYEGPLDRLTGPRKPRPPAPPAAPPRAPSR